MKQTHPPPVVAAIAKVLEDPDWRSNPQARAAITEWARMRFRTAHTAQEREQLADDLSMLWRDYDPGTIDAMVGRVRDSAARERRMARGTRRVAVTGGLWIAATVLFAVSLIDSGGTSAVALAGVAALVIVTAITARRSLRIIARARRRDRLGRARAAQHQPQLAAVSSTLLTLADRTAMRAPGTVATPMRCPGVRRPMGRPRARRTAARRSAGARAGADPGDPDPGEPPSKSETGRPRQAPPHLSTRSGTTRRDDRRHERAGAEL